MKTWVESRKQQKRNYVLDLIRHSPKPLSRFDIKKLTGYSMTTVSSGIADLLKDGLLTEDVCADAGRMGRKPVFLHLNSSGGYFIGIEFNIESIHYAILDFTCKPLYAGQADIPEKISTPLLLDLIVQKTQECFDYLGNQRVRVLGIGLGLPGYINAASGVALTYPHLPDWVNIPVVSMMEKTFGTPCHIGNNVGVMGLVFKWIHEFHEENDFLLISIRSGVRCIPVLNQQPYSGRISNTGEIGHLKVSTGSRVCDCGKTGCLNTEISNFSIRAKLEEGFQEGRYLSIKKLAAGARPTVAMLVHAALNGDSEAIELIRQSGCYLGTAIAEAANLFAPQKIILSGRLTKAGELFFEPLRKRVEEQCLSAVFQHMEILSSPFGDGIGALGAAALTLEREFNPLISIHDF